MATFEELAERLARAGSAAERVEAAEQLSALDDPRVAPALARALSDCDPDVSRRIEELLAQFCHRDHTGHLRALLEEAERVSAALASEVSRLRDGAPQEQALPPPEPIEPPEGFDGPCQVLRLTSGPLDVRHACQLVADATGQQLFAVTRQLHLTRGFLAATVPADVARRLVRELAAAGVPAAAAPSEWLPEPLELLRLRDPTFAADGLRGTVVPEGRACEVPWHTVELVAAGRLEVELRRRRADEDWSPFTRPLKPRGEEPGLHEPGYEYVIEAFGGEPVERLRLLTHQLDFDVMQRRPSGFSSVARLARGFVRFADRSRLAAGVRRLAELDAEGWDDLTFLSSPAFERYVAWQRLLLRLGVPLPR